MKNTFLVEIYTIAIVHKHISISIDAAAKTESKHTEYGICNKHQTAGEPAVEPRHGVIE